MDGAFLMQYFQDTATAKIWAFNPGVVVADLSGIPTTLQPYTPPAPTAAQIAAQAQILLAGQASVALTKSDITITRCYEHAVAVPTEWQTYRAALRAIVAGTSTATALPTIPAYPAGT
jgi:hypothetical protein